MNTPQLPPDWLQALTPEFQEPYMASLREFLVRERQQHRVYPKGQEMFAAFWHSPLKQTKVVIVGQDPYHGPGQAHGLSFSVQRDCKIPPSLQNIFREQKTDIGIAHQPHGNLADWARQGVLLLNTVLSVRAHQAHSHRNQGWEIFTTAALKAVNEHATAAVFVLWGSAARRIGQYVDQGKHLVLTAPHPSPLSAHRGFFGCRHFSQINKWLEAKGTAPIDWQLR